MPPEKPEEQQGQLYALQIGRGIHVTMHITLWINYMPFSP
jgi:hypothetical protein